MLDEEREELKNEIIAAQRNLLRQYEQQPDEAYFDEYLNRLWDIRSSEADDDRALGEIFSPCKKRYSGDNEDAPELQLTYALEELFKVWTELVKSCSELKKLKEYTNIPLPRKLAKIDLYPLCSFALIRALQRELATLWLALKQTDLEHLDAAYLDNDDEMLNAAEQFQITNMPLTLVIVNIVECKIEMSDVYIETKSIVEKYRNDIISLANDFFNGTAETVRNHDVAENLYRQALLPFAKQRLKEIELLKSNKSH